MRPAIADKEGPCRVENAASNAYNKGDAAFKTGASGGRPKGAPATADVAAGRGRRAAGTGEPTGAAPAGPSERRGVLCGGGAQRGRVSGGKKSEPFDKISTGPPNPRYRSTCSCGATQRVPRLGLCDRPGQTTLGRGGGLRGRPDRTERPGCQAPRCLDVQTSKHLSGMALACSFAQEPKAARGLGRRICIAHRVTCMQQKVPCVARSSTGTTPGGWRVGSTPYLGHIGFSNMRAHPSFLRQERTS